MELKAELHAEDKRSGHGINKRKNASKAKWKKALMEIAYAPIVENRI